ncbi:MAG: hypothetical protein IJQ73_10030 [Kiritimatiellae bacterium]|nr:hypothetical protein [Kiritimatiellia bacterium]
MAGYLPLMALRDGVAFRNLVRRRGVGGRGLLSLALFVCLSCAVYGAVLGCWRSPLLALYVAAKLPLLLLGTMLLVSVFNWVASLLLGAGFGLRDVLAVVAGAMCVAGWILLACAPVALFLVWAAAPSVGSPGVLRQAHNVMLLTHMAVLAAAGLAGNAALLTGLRNAVPSGCHAGVLAGVWLAAYAFVGCQLSWILRPFLGSPFFDVVFLRPDALDRNFYEFIFADVVPALLGFR